MNITDRTHQYLQSGRRWYQRHPSKITKLTVHHSAIPHGRYQTDDQVLNAIRDIHVGHGWPGLSYHYVIPKSGKIYKTNNHEDITWHDTVNNDSLGILVDGYFHANINDKPTQAQLNSLRWLLDKLCTKHPEFPADHNDVVGHRERSSTACPGDHLIGYVVDYRNNRGQVNWGDGQTTESSCEKKLAETQKVLKQEVAFLKDERKKYEKAKGEISKLTDSVDALMILRDEKDATIKQLQNDLKLAKSKTHCQQLEKDYEQLQKKYDLQVSKMSRLLDPKTVSAGQLFRAWLKKAF